MIVQTNRHSVDNCHKEFTEKSGVAQGITGEADDRTRILPEAQLPTHLFNSRPTGQTVKLAKQVQHARQEMAVFVRDGFLKHRSVPHGVAHAMVYDHIPRVGRDVANLITLNRYRPGHLRRKVVHVLLRLPQTDRRTAHGNQLTVTLVVEVLHAIIAIRISQHRVKQAVTRHGTLVLRHNPSVFRVFLIVWLQRYGRHAKPMFATAIIL